MNTENSALLKRLVKDNNIAFFKKYFDGQLWYRVESMHATGSMDALEFPVPISDIGNATFLACDKAILFMRYIRKHLEMLERAAKPQCPMLGCGPQDECPGHMDGHNA